MICNFELDYDLICAWKSSSLKDNVETVRVHVWHCVRCCAPCVMLFKAWNEPSGSPDATLATVRVHPSVWAERGLWLIRPITAALRCRWAQWRQTGGNQAKRSVLSPGQTGSQTSRSSLFSVLYVTGLCRSSEWVFFCDYHHQHQEKKSIKSKWMDDI